MSQHTRNTKEECNMLSNKPECPNCSTILDGFRHSSGHKKIRPEEGDISICLNCGTFIQFDKNLNLNYADPEALTEIDPLTIQKMRRTSKMYNMLSNKQAHKESHV